MDYDIEKIVAALKTNRREFSTLFLQAQAEAGLLLDERINFEVVARDLTDDRKAYEQAITYALAGGFIEDFILVAARSTLEDGYLSSLLMEMPEEGSLPALQALNNSTRGFTDPAIHAQGILRSIHITGKVLVNGDAKGSGVLIGPNLFLTAWHVTLPLFDAQTWLPKPQVSLAVQFDDFITRSGGAFRPGKALTVDAHTDWYVHHSRCHHHELADSLP